jgi:hypothetical protein
MTIFDFGAEAELYPGRAKGFTRQTVVGYKRFERAADAVRFAVEELPTESLPGACLEVGEERYNGLEIQDLYERADYPLQRRPRAQPNHARAAEAPRAPGARSPGKKSARRARS